MTTKQRKPISDWEQLMQDPEQRKRGHQELLLLDVSRQINLLMKRAEVSDYELARAIDEPVLYVREVLAAERNLTLRELSDIFLALNRRVKISDQKAQ